jgi:hypothetical protein
VNIEGKSALFVRNYSRTTLKTAGSLLLLLLLPEATSLDGRLHRGIGDDLLQLLQRGHERLLRVATLYNWLRPTLGALAALRQQLPPPSWCWACGACNCGTAHECRRQGGRSRSKRCSPNGWMTPPVDSAM